MDVKKATQKMKKYGGTLVGSRALGTNRRKSDYDFVFTDKDKLAKAKKFLDKVSIERTDLKFAEYDARDFYGVSRSYDGVFSRTQYKVRVSVVFDVFYNKKIWSKKKQRKMHYKGQTKKESIVVK